MDSVWRGQFFGLEHVSPYPTSWDGTDEFLMEVGPVQQTINAGLTFFARRWPNRKVTFHYVQDEMEGRDNPQRCREMPLLALIDLLWEVQVSPPVVDVKALPTRQDLVNYVTTFAPEEAEWIAEYSDERLQFTGHWLYSKTPRDKMCDLLRSALEERGLVF